MNACHSAKFYSNPSIRLRYPGNTQTDWEYRMYSEVV